MEEVVVGVARSEYGLDGDDQPECLLRFTKKLEYVLNW